MLKKEQKEEIVKNLIAELKKQNMAFYNFDKVSSQEMVDLRRKANELNLKTTVIKRKLIEKALKKSQIEAELPQGSYFIASSAKDEVTPFKFIAQFIKETEKGIFQGGIFEKSFINASEAEKIADLPSKEELKAKLVFILKSPLQKLSYDLSYNLVGLINILKQKAETQN